MEDTDFDGIGDCFDLDSDNDGCDDVVESGGNDDNDDGRLNGHPTVDGIGTATPGQVTNGSTEGGYNGANGSEIVSDTFTVAITPDPGIACDGEDFVFTATATGTRVTDLELLEVQVMILQLLYLREITHIVGISVRVLHL